MSSKNIETKNDILESETENTSEIARTSESGKIYVYGSTPVSGFLEGAHERCDQLGLASYVFVENKKDYDRFLKNYPEINDLCCQCGEPLVPEITKTFVPEITPQIATTSKTVDLRLKSGAIDPESETEKNPENLLKLVSSIYAADPCSLCTKNHGGLDQHCFYFSRLSRSAHVDCIKKFEEEMPYIAALRYIVRCGCIGKKLPMGTRADFEQYVCSKLIGKPLEVVLKLNPTRKTQVELIAVIDSIEWLSLHCESKKNCFSPEKDDLKWLDDNQQDLIDAWDKLVTKISNLVDWPVMMPLSPCITSKTYLLNNMDAQPKKILSQISLPSTSERVFSYEKLIHGPLTDDLKKIISTPGLLDENFWESTLSVRKSTTSLGNTKVINFIVDKLINTTKDLSPNKMIKGNPYFDNRGDEWCNYPPMYYLYNFKQPLWFATAIKLLLLEPKLIGQDMLLHMANLVNMNILQVEYRNSFLKALDCFVDGELGQANYPLIKLKTKLKDGTLKVVSPAPDDMQLKYKVSLLMDISPIDWKSRTYSPKWILKCHDDAMKIKKMIYSSSVEVPFELKYWFKYYLSVLFSFQRTMNGEEHFKKSLKEFGFVLDPYYMIRRYNEPYERYNLKIWFRKYSCCKQVYIYGDWWRLGHTFYDEMYGLLADNFLSPPKVKTARL